MEYVDYSVSNRLAYITLNRPEKRNALNDKLVKELTQAFKFAEKDENAKVIVLNALGDSFCAGADLAYLKSLQSFTFEENLADSRNLKDLFHLIYNLKKVVIAQVEGHAIAGGAGLATVCDIVFSVPEAKFGFTEVKIGFVPAIVSIFAIRKFRESWTKRLLLTGDIINSSEAKECGIVNFIKDKDAIKSEVKAFAENLINNTSSNSLKLTKKLIAEIQQKDLNSSLEYASELNATARKSDDCKKGINSFLNKEKINW
ncbi:MAG: enoyl-CoA hydratase/isomerase family protein [Bacteroidales bacterium]|nr:enoyl-CoA hydratase/isomerase family protein [Bacteroidales bacterium]MBN2756165.1 enoyl-CoA hydratase/isomerase family protein [Bacteroidales bacterium]